jgi:antirestriction protein ArdC
MHPTQNTSTSKEDIYQEVTNKLIKLLENGTVPWKQLFKTSEHGFAQNYCTKHQYSGINWFLLNFVAEYEVPYYLTWKQVQTLGGKVIKGSQAEQIYYLNFYYTDKEGKKLTSAQVKKAQENEIPIEKRPYLRRYNVFNISCIEGIEWEKSEISVQEIEPINRCETLLDAIEDVPKIQFIDQQSAYYSPLLDTINMPKLQQFALHGAEAYYRVLFHELIHWTGHNSRLSRKGINDMQTESKMLYAEEELIAELGACMLASFTGIQEENLLHNSAAYLQSWLNCMKEDKRFIFRVAPQAENAVKYILDS